MSIKNQWGDVKFMNPTPEVGDVFEMDICPYCVFEKDKLKDLNSKEMFK